MPTEYILFQYKVPDVDSMTIQITISSD